LNFFIRLITHVENPREEPKQRPVPDFLLDTSWQQYHIFWSASDALDQKASTLLSAVGVVIALLVSLRPTAGVWYSVNNVIYLLGLMFLVICGYFALKAYEVKSFEALSKPIDNYNWFMHPALKDAESETKAMLIRQIDGAIENNKKIIKEKTEKLRIAHSLLLFGLLLIAARACVR
jgi:hypothetical protein